MGSLEEDNLLQMVHDFIESSDSKISSSSLLSHNFYNPPTTQKHVLSSTRYFTLQEMLRKKTREEKEIIDKICKHMKNKMDLEKTSGLRQWLVKCLKLDGFIASFCHTSWLTTPSCPCGNYEYIEIVKDGEAKGGSQSQRLIVDIDFKSQFEVARPTQSYKDLSSKLPMIFVGNEDKLKRIISLLCSAAEESLRERGLHIPPWRKPTYMQSKWKLTNYTNNNKFSFHNNNNNSNTNNNDNININTNNNNNNNVDFQSRLEKRRREMGGMQGSGLTNHFSNLSINCC